jgi:CrcB protein
MLGAALGGVARYVIGLAVMQRFGGRFPLGTLVVNVSGCFLIGFIATILTERLDLNPNWRLFLVTGLLGGYTTFSSFGYETYQLARMDAPVVGLLNVAASVVLGYAAVWLGVLAAAKR